MVLCRKSENGSGVVDERLRRSPDAAVRASAPPAPAVSAGGDRFCAVLRRVLAPSLCRKTGVVEGGACAAWANPAEAESAATLAGWRDLPAESRVGMLAAALRKGEANHWTHGRPATGARRVR